MVKYEIIAKFKAHFYQVSYRTKYIFRLYIMISFKIEPSLKKKR